MCLFGWAVVLPGLWYDFSLCLGEGKPSLGSESNSISLPHGGTTRSALPLLGLLSSISVDNCSISLASTFGQKRCLVKPHFRGVCQLLLTSSNLGLQGQCVPSVNPKRRKKRGDQSCLLCHKMDELGNELFCYEQRQTKMLLIPKNHETF